jgi:hypothetical protein
MRFPSLLRFLAGVGFVVLLTWAAHRTSGDDKPAEKTPARDDKETERADANDLHLEVTALQVVHQLKANPAQLKALAAAAATTAPKLGARKVVKLSDRYHKTLRALREAFGDSNEEEIDKQLRALEELREKEEPDFDEIEITAEARKAAPELLKKFSARQLVGYLSGSGDEFPDPTEQLNRGMEQARELKGKEWRDYRDNLAYQLGWLVGGVNEEAEVRVRDQVTALLTRVNSLEEKAYKEQREQIDKEAREILGKLTPTDVIRHFLERTLTELLSNPRLQVALETRLKKARAAEKGG